MIYNGKSLSIVIKERLFIFKKIQSNFAYRYQQHHLLDLQ